MSQSVLFPDAPVKPDAQPPGVDSAPQGGRAEEGARTRPRLRAYQDEALRMIGDAAMTGARSPLVVLPTGAGKTVIAAELIRRYRGAGRASLFLAPRRELIDQTSDKLAAVGVEHGVMLADADPLAGPSCPVQVASVDTLLARVVRRGDAIRDFDLVIVDEAHLGISAARADLLSRWPNALRVGLTATPSRKDGLALGTLYDRLLVPTTVADLTRDGYLVPARYFSWPTPDLRGIGTVGGDYSPGALQRRALETPELMGDVVTTWLAHAADRRTVVFATGIDHSIALSAAFRAQGVAAEHVDANTPGTMRAAIMRRFRSGETQVLTNCFLAAYGFDLPALSCVVLARPTKSLVLYLQMLGRGLRPVDGKRECLVLDHAGCVHRFGFATDAREWTLDGKYALSEAGQRDSERKDAHECPACHAMFRGQAICPECGFELKPAARMVPAIDGELVEIGQVERVNQEKRQRFYAELQHIAAQRRYKSGWAAQQYKAKFGVFPPWAWNDLPTESPSAATEGWVKSRAIAWAKSQWAKPRSQYDTAVGMGR